MITKNNLKEHLEKLLQDVTPGDMQTITNRIGEHITYSLQHYDELDEDAKRSTDNCVDAIKKHSAHLLQQLPDTKTKRRLARLHASSIGKHFNIGDHINELETPVKNMDVGLREYVRISSEGLKYISDFIFDITQKHIQGSSTFAQLSLLMLCVNELLVTLHLLKHKYVNQAYSHIRTVFEHLDKIELFRVQPKWADAWVGDDEKLKWKELRPAEVRKKLGKKKYDPIYSLFSSLGVHGSFNAVKIQSSRKAKKEGDSRPCLSFWVGGTPFEHNTVWANGFAVYALYSVLLQLMRSFEPRLDTEEGMEILEKIFTELKAYVLNHFLSWAKKVKLETNDFEEFLQKKSWSSIKNQSAIVKDSR